MRGIGIGIWLVCGAAMAHGQIASPKFDVASVKVVTPDGRGGGGRTMGGPGTSDPGHYVAPVSTMVGLLMTAYGVDNAQIIGPAWMRQVGSPFYEVMATMPPDTAKEQFQAMMQNLLAERFHLKVHHESRDFPAYELVPDSGGAKLRASLPQPETPPPTGLGLIIMHSGVGDMAVKDASMDDFAQQLEMKLVTFERISTQKMNSPTPRVANKTGLLGTYSFKLEFSQPGPPGFTPEPGSPAADLPDLFTVLRAQLGLRLNKVQALAVDVIVVENVDKQPVEN